MYVAAQGLSCTGSLLQHVGSLLGACEPRGGMRSSYLTGHQTQTPPTPPPPPALGVRSLSHWTTREVPIISIFIHLKI